jgi:hypothetical protein
LDRRLGGPQSRSGRGGEEKNSQPPPGIDLLLLVPNIWILPHETKACLFYLSVCLVTPLAAARTHANFFLELVLEAKIAPLCFHGRNIFLHYFYRLSITMEAINRL